MTKNNAYSTEKKLTLLVMAGGTGGHIFPGLAVAQKLKNEGWTIHWLGTPDRMEAEIVPAHGFAISFINISGLRHKNLLTRVIMPFKLLNSLIQALTVIKKVKPDVVLGMGGYASGPGGLAAWLMRKPLLVHEQNAAAGLTNRLLAKIATKVCCAFPNAFSANTVVEVVGNPLRASIGADSATQKQVEHPENNKVKTSRNILVVGGSLGAQVLNETVPVSFAKLIELNKEKQNNLSFHVWHQTGKGKKEQVVTAYQQHQIIDEQHKVSEFIEDMASAYQWADVVICRAGALTVSELAMAATPAIFVPLPHAVDDHQTKNAQYLVSRDAALLIKQEQLTSDVLATQLNELFSQPHTLQNMAKSAFAAADVEATQKVADICLQLAAA